MHFSDRGHRNRTPMLGGHNSCGPTLASTCVQGSWYSRSKRKHSSFQPTNVPSQNRSWYHGATVTCQHCRTTRGPIKGDDENVGQWFGVWYCTTIIAQHHPTNHSLHNLVHEQDYACFSFFCLAVNTHMNFLFNYCIPGVLAGGPTPPPDQGNAE